MVGGAHANQFRFSHLALYRSHDFLLTHSDTSRGFFGGENQSKPIVGQSSSALAEVFPSPSDSRECRLDNRVDK